MAERGILWTWMHKLSRPQALDDVRDYMPTVQEAHAPVAYRLVRWPELPHSLRTAGILRALSVMTHRTVSPVRFARLAGWDIERAQAFLDALVVHGDATKTYAPPRH